MAKAPGKRKQLAVAHGAALDWVSRSPESQAALRNLEYINTRLRKTGGALSGKEESWSEQHGKYRPTVAMTSKQRARLAKGKGPVKAEQPKYIRPGGPDDLSWGWRQVEQVGSLVPATIQLGKMLGQGTFEDLTKQQGVPGAILYGLTAGKTRRPGAASLGQGKTTDLGKTMGLGLLQSTKDLGNVEKWREDTAMQVINAAGFALAPVRAASAAKLATTLGRLNPELTALQAARLGVKESFNPGFAAAQGLQGGIGPRVIKGKYAEAPGRMPSRNPVGRGLQRGVDVVSERLDVREPGMRGSSSSRAAAANRRAAKQAEARRKALNLSHEELVAGVISPTKWDKAKALAGLSGKIDPSVASALIAALEGPVGATVREAVDLKIKGMQSVLDQNVPNAAIRDGIEDLKTQRQEALDADPDFDAAPLNKQIAEQQAVLDFKLGKSVPPVTGSPIRDSVLTNMRQTLGKQRANETIKVWDAVARGANPRNPGQWYLENIAEVKRMPVEQFAPEGGALFQRMAGGQGGWYFPLQRALEGMPEGRMQVGQLIGVLRKQGISPEELRNSTLLELAEIDKNLVVTPKQMLDELTNDGYFRALDPDITITRHDPTVDPNSGYSTRYHLDSLNSRDIDASTEYYEMVVRYPELRGTQTGYSHWQQPGNVYHVRFQVFMDEADNRVMLVDEIQSDWASDYRKAGGEGEPGKARSPEETEQERVALREELRGAGEALQEKYEYYAELQAERQRMVDEGENPHEPEFVARTAAAQDAVDDALQRHREAQIQEGDFERTVEMRVQPSPMGSGGRGNRYAQNAIRQVLRHADSDNVDYVVLVDGHTQALRNHEAVELGVDQDVTAQAGRTETIGRNRLQYGEWIDDQTAEPLTNEQITAKLREQSAGVFTRLYNKEFPDTFKDVAGAEGRYLDDAYEGRYSAQAEQYDYSGYDGYVQPESGGMPGTVFEMTDDVKAKIREDQPLYRRNFDGVPQGATEFLADGRARLTMFQTADVSTWVHELAHVAVRDLDPDDLRILEREIAESRSYGDWTEADQEKLARSFETYMRDGHAAPALREVFSKISKWMRDLWRKTSAEAEQISPETADVFDRMLGRREANNTVLLDDAEINQVKAVIKDLNDALDSGDLVDLEDAATALAKLSDDAEAAGIQILMRNARSPEHAAAIMDGLRERKNIVVEDYRRRGLIDHAEDARGYFPQMSMWEALGQPQVEASRIGAVGDVIGTPRVTSKALNKNRNKLVRHQLGEVLNDPTAVMYILRARLRVLETIKARDELYAVGEPVRADEALPDQDKFTFIRDPGKTPTKIDRATEAAATLSRRDFSKIQARRLADDTDEISGAEAIQGEMVWTKGDGERPSWVTSEANVRYVPKRVAQKRVGEVFSSGPPKGPLAMLGSGFGMLNAATRAALIYAPLFGARYMARNWIQNAVLMAVTQPSAFFKLMSNHKLRRNHPQLWDRINEEFGTIQAQALPEFNVRAQGKVQRTERNVNRVSGQIGEHLGRVADVPLRAASWRRHAERYGFTTPEDYTRLLDDPELAEIRNTISQRVREDMIDFDALGPWEKEVLTRYFFIWPFIRGSTKWPFMFAREYPERLVAASYLTAGTRGEQTREEMLKAGDYDLGWLDPTKPAFEKLEAAHETIVRGSKGQISLKPLITEALAPQYQETIDMLNGGRSGGWEDLWERVVPEFIPFVSTYQKAHKGQLVDFAKGTFGKQTRPRSVEKRAAKWMGELDSVVSKIEKADIQLSPKVKAQIEQMRVAYGDWEESSSKAKWANQKEGIDSVSQAERAGLALEVMHEHYPVKYAELDRQAKAGGWGSMEEVIASGIGDNAKIYRKIYDDMFGLKEDFMRDAKKGGWVE